MRVAVTLIAALAAATPRAFAQPSTSAEEHREAGYAHVERGEWDDAIYEYEAAYALDHDPVSLYAIGKGVPVERATAAWYFERACQLGSAIGCENQAVLREDEAAAQGAEP